MNKKTISQNSDFIIYSSPEGNIKIDVLFENGNVWLTQKKIAELFGVGIPAINKHLKNIFKEKELDKSSVISILETTAKDKKKYKTQFYNLDSIIAVGYRVNSKRATQFRIWATQKLKEYIIKGFVLNDEKLKEGKRNTYFDELIERVREIRTSERNFYQKITDIYSTSIDYDKNSELTKEFFATVQNKMHFGIHGKTAAEIILERANSKKKNMGITCISERKINQSDIFIAKNYLNKKELSELNLIVDQYLSFAELQARNNKIMKMKDWILKLDNFLKLNEKEILKNKGKISKKIADEKAIKEFKKFKKIEDKKFVSDFDEDVKRFLRDYEGRYKI
jgi:hypothetical protein